MAENAQDLYGILNDEKKHRLILLSDDGVVHGEFDFDDIITILPQSLPKRDPELPGQASEYRLLAVYEKNVPLADESEKEQTMLADVSLNHLPQAVLDQFFSKGLPDHLSSCIGHDPAPPNLHIIVSVKSGTLEAENYFENVVQPTLAAFGIHSDDYQLIHTASAKTIADFTTSTLLPAARRGEEQSVLLLSGDGGIVDIVNGLLSETHTPTYVKPNIGLFVLGTGNALANSSKLNRDNTRGLRSFLRGKPKAMPTFTVRFSPGSMYIINEGRQAEALPKDEAGDGILHGAVVCSWALHASLVADSDTTEYRKHGSARFSMAAQELLNPKDGSESHKYRGKITLFKADAGGKEERIVLKRREHMYVLATLVQRLEKALNISPKSQPLDGVLRLVHFGPTASSEVVKVFGRAFKDGGHVKEENVGYEDIVGMRIDFEEEDGKWRRVCVDGRIVRVDKGGWVEVRTEKRDVADLVVDL